MLQASWATIRVNTTSFPPKAEPENLQNVVYKVNVRIKKFALSLKPSDSWFDPQPEHS